MFWNIRTEKECQQIYPDDTSNTLDLILSYVALTTYFLCIKRGPEGTHNTNTGKTKMKEIADLLFEANILKEIPRSGYHFLGAGRESIAEHSFGITFIAYVMSQMEPEIDSLRLISMCLVHDLPEARIGDLNYVQKKYLTPDEGLALKDMADGLPFGAKLTELVNEFSSGESLEARLARDADQLALILELKALIDLGHPSPSKWLPAVLERLETDTGKALAENIMKTERDSWWQKTYQDPHRKLKNHHK